MCTKCNSINSCLQKPPSGAKEMSKHNHFLVPVVGFRKFPLKSKNGPASGATGKDRGSPTSMLHLLGTKYVHTKVHVNRSNSC